MYGRPDHPAVTCGTTVRSGAQVMEVSAEPADHVAPSRTAGRGLPSCSGRCSSRSGRAVAPTRSTSTVAESRLPARADGSTSLSPCPACPLVSAHPGRPRCPIHSHPHVCTSPARRHGVAHRPAQRGQVDHRPRLRARAARPRPARRGPRRRRGAPAPRGRARLLPRGPRDQHPADRLGRRAAGPQRRARPRLGHRTVPGRARPGAGRARGQRHALPGGARQHPRGGGGGARRQGPLRAPAGRRDLRADRRRRPVRGAVGSRPRHRRARAPRRGVGRAAARAPHRPRARRHDGPRAAEYA